MIDAYALDSWELDSKNVDSLNNIGNVDSIVSSPAHLDERKSIAQGLAAIRDSIQKTPKQNLFSSEAIQLTAKTEVPASYYLISICDQQEVLLSQKVRVEKDHLDRFQLEMKHLDEELIQQGKKLIKQEYALSSLSTVQDVLTFVGHGTTLALSSAVLLNSAVTTTSTGISISSTSVGLVPLITGIGGISFAALGLTHFVLQKSGLMHKAVSCLPIRESRQNKIETASNIGLSAASLIGSTVFTGAGLYNGAVKATSIGLSQGLQRSAGGVLKTLQGGTYALKGISEVKLSNAEWKNQTIENKREITQRQSTIALDNTTKALDTHEMSFESLATSLKKRQERTHALLQQA